MTSRAELWLCQTMEREGLSGFRLVVDSPDRNRVEIVLLPLEESEAADHVLSLKSGAVHIDGVSWLYVRDTRLDRLDGTDDGLVVEGVPTIGPGTELETIPLTRPEE